MVSMLTQDCEHEATSKREVSLSAPVIVDQRGFRCPLPLLALKRAMRASDVGAIVELLATDPDSARDVPLFVKDTGLTLLSADERDGVFSFHIMK